MKNINQILETEYPIEIHKIEENNGGFYYMAFLPDFGYATCAATGDTKEEAIAELDLVKKDVLQFFFETGRKITKPSKPPF